MKFQESNECMMSGSGKTILVTGGGGYIGSHCIVELLKEGFEVVAVDNFINSIRGSKIMIFPSTNDIMLGAENTHLLIRGSITVCPTSCLTTLDSAALLMFNQQQIYLFAPIQANQGGQLYSGTSSPKVSECCLLRVSVGIPV